MAPSSSSSPSKSPVPSLHPSLHFTPIPECEEDNFHEERYKNRATPSSDGGSSATPSRHRHHRRSNEENNYQHTLTPLHHNGNRKRQDHDDEYGGAVSCNKCRPHHSHRDKFSVVPLESHHHNNNNNPSFISSPNLIIKSIFQSLTRRSPKPSSAAPLPPRSSSSSASASAADASREEQWRLAVAELSHKLIQATKKKEDAVVEASRLKTSMSELEKKLNKLEIYCHNLKSGLDECSNNNKKKQNVPVRKDTFNDRIIQQFLVSVSESRSSIRALSRALASQLRTVGGKVYERLSLLLQPFDVKINSFAKNPKSLIFYLEAILSRAFFEDFEASGFQKNGSTRILNPIDRCESNYASFNVLMELTWDEVLSRGTKHFSEEFSRFCDRKMSDVVSMLCWNRAWPEPLLQAFFGASKSVWLVHLLANSVNPGLQIFRVEKDDRFDPVYMEETGGDRYKSVVRAMVQPGFYVYGSVVKCKVVCKHCGDEEEVVEDRVVKECNKSDKSLISICSPLAPGTQLKLFKKLVAGESDKVKLNLYYESLCPGCQVFIVNYLVKIFDSDLHTVTDLKLVPFGNAKVSDNLTVTCQHGEEECKLNAIEACAIRTWPDSKKHYSFIRCVENDTTKWESCLKNSRSEKAINDCYNSDLPKTLILGYANMTLSLKPQHKYVPWVTLNSKPLNAESPDDFVAQICKAYKGKAALPKLCNSSAFSKSLESKVLKLQVSYADEARN